MVKWTLHIVSILIVLFAVSAGKISHAQDTGVSRPDPLMKIRRVNWNSSRNAIRNFESGTFITETETELVFDDVVAGLESTIRYQFHNNKMVRVRIRSLDRYRKAEKMVEDYFIYRDFMEAMLGPPDKEATDFRRDEFKSTPTRWAIGAMRGFVTFQADWALDNEKQVSVIMGGTNFRPNLRIEMENPANRGEPPKTVPEQYTPFGQ